MRTVDKVWNEVAPQAQIKSINEGRLALREVLVGMSAAQAVDWLTANPYCKGLEYANFTGFYDLDNTCLQKLTDNCPNLKHLLIPSCNISGDALKHQAKVSRLQSLSVTECLGLEEDALKHLENIPVLKSLNLMGCWHLGEDALKHLAHVPGLKSLNIRRCTQLQTESIPPSLKLVINGP